MSEMDMTLLGGAFGLASRIGYKIWGSAPSLQLPDCKGYTDSSHAWWLGMVLVVVVVVGPGFRKPCRGSRFAPAGAVDQGTGVYYTTALQCCRTRELMLVRIPG